MKAIIIGFSFLVLLLAPCIGQTQWVQTNGPYGGDVYAFATIGSNLFAATADLEAPGGGVFLSTDSGKSWENKNNGLTSTNVWALAVIGGTLFAGTDSGVFRSNNGSWTSSSNGLGNIGVRFLLASGTILYAIAAGELYRSKDGGQNWTMIAPELGVSSPGSALAVCGGYLFVLAGDGIYRSADTGATWIPVNNGVITNTGGPSGPFGVMGNNIFVCAGETTSVYSSTDYGDNWQVTGLTNTDVEGGFAVIGTSIFAGSLYDMKIYLSTDSGLTWRGYNEKLGNLQTLGVLGTNLFAGTTLEGTASIFGGSGVYRSEDSGKSWTFSSTNMTNSSVAGLAPIGSNLFANVLDVGLLVTTDDGKTWSASDLLGNDSTDVYQVSDSNLLAVTQDSVVYISTNDGSSWTQVDAGPNAYFQTFARIGSSIFAGSGGYGVYLSSDSGLSWNPVNSGLPKGYDIQYIVALGTNLFASSYYNIGVYRSTDKGSSWFACNNGLPNTNVYNLAVVGNDLFVTNENYGVLRSTDSGTSWSSMNVDFSDSEWVVSLFATNGNIFAISLHGIYLSTNRGLAWISVNEGLGIDSNDVNLVTVSGNNLYAGTEVAGVWRRPLSEMIPTSTVAGRPTISPEIETFPNPFSQSTTVTFSSPENEDADVTIINILGTQVARIFSGELGAGEHSFSWDGSGMPPGVYECIMRVNGNVQRVSLAHF